MGTLDTLLIIGVVLVGGYFVLTTLGKQALGQIHGGNPMSQGLLDIAKHGYGDYDYY